eukprot:2458329-Amphidinium_carterae.1
MEWMPNTSVTRSLLTLALSLVGGQLQLASLWMERAKCGCHECSHHSLRAFKGHRRFDKRKK